MMLNRIQVALDVSRIIIVHSVRKPANAVVPKQIGLYQQSAYLVSQAVQKGADARNGEACAAMRTSCTRASKRSRAEADGPLSTACL